MGDIVLGADSFCAIPSEFERNISQNRARPTTEEKEQTIIPMYGFTTLAVIV